MALALSAALHLGLMLGGHLESLVPAPKPPNVIEARLVARAAPRSASVEPAREVVTNPPQRATRRALLAKEDPILPPAPTEMTETPTRPPVPDEPETDDRVAETPIAETVPNTTEAPQTAAPSVAMPQRIEIEFAVARSSGGTGIARHVWQRIGDDRYRIESTLEATGLASLFMQGKYTQTSEGTIGANGLAPERFSVERRNKSETARFNRDANRIEFSGGREAAELPPGAQDLLSFTFQFAFEPPQRKSLNLALTNGRKLGQYNYLVLEDETLPTPVGAIPTVHIFKLHEPDDDGLEMWLAPSLFYAPLRMLRVEKDGTRYELNITALRITS